MLTVNNFHRLLLLILIYLTELTMSQGNKKTTPIPSSLFIEKIVIDYVYRFMIILISSIELIFTHFRNAKVFRLRY